MILKNQKFSRRRQYLRLKNAYYRYKISRTLGLGEWQCQKWLNYADKEAHAYAKMTGFYNIAETKPTVVAETKPTVVWDRKTPRLRNNHVFSDLGREINVGWKAGFFDWIVYRRNPWITQNTMDKLLHNQYGIRGKVWFTDATPPT